MEEEGVSTRWENQAASLVEAPEEGEVAAPVPSSSRAALAPATTRTNAAKLNLLGISILYCFCVSQQGLLILYCSVKQMGIIELSDFFAVLSCYF